MNPRKRQASDIPSTRRHKQPRLAMKGYGGGTSSPSEKEGILSRWIRFSKEFGNLSIDTLCVIFQNISLRQSSDLREPDFLNSSSSSTLQQIPWLAVSSPSNGSSDSPGEIKLARQTLQTQSDHGKITLENTQISNQVAPTGGVNRMLQSSIPNQEELKSERDTQEPEYADLLSTSRTTSLSLLKDSPFPPADSSLTSWSSVKDDLSDRTRSLPLGSSSSLGLLQKFRFSAIPPNSYPPPDSHIPSRKSSTLSRRGTSRQYNRNRPHIHERVHKAKVQQERAELQRELLKKEYNFKRHSGLYKSSFKDFIDLKDYKKILQDLNLAIEPYPPPPKLLQGDLKLKLLAENPVQRALDSANATLNSPKPPKPYIPNLDQIRILHRTRDEEIERRIRPPATPLPSRLPPADDANVSAILLQHGVVSKFAREQVSDQDIARLAPGQWLNDELINFYGAMILARSEGSKENPGCQRNGKTTKKATFLDAHYFSSFFWSKLTKEGYERGRLAKWTKKIDIFGKDIILIPVNHHNAHWTAAAINFKEKRVESYDSMGMAKDKVFTHLRSYINAEHMNKKKKPFDFTDWKNWAPDSTPQQENGYDCGVFTCQFLETLSRGEESFKFSQQNMPYLRRRMIWEIGNGQLRDDHY